MYIQIQIRPSFHFDKFTNHVLMRKPLFLVSLTVGPPPWSLPVTQVTDGQAGSGAKYVAGPDGKQHAGDRR